MPVRKTKLGGEYLAKGLCLVQQVYRPRLVTTAGLEFLCLNGLEKDLSLVDLLPQLAVMLRELILLLLCLDLLMLGEV